MFEADGNAHQAVADAELGALRRREPLVRGRRRMGDEALGVAEIVADADELERVLKRNAAFLPPVISKATSVDPPRICFCAILACGWSGRPG